MDIKLSLTGELEIGTDGDFKFVTGDEEIAQHIMFRLQTQTGDYLLASDCGADLERFIGESLNGVTAGLVQSQVYSAITKDNLLFGPSVSAIQVPPNTILVVVEWKSATTKRVAQVSSSLDLRSGEVISRFGYR